MHRFFKWHIDPKQVIFLLVLTGIFHISHAQEIIINESDSSWMGKEVPAKELEKKKFSLFRRWFQNTVTHYNFYFNAHETLRKTIARAEEIHHDDYDSVLSIHPYLPADFEMISGNLDSIIRNAGIGIEIHDPRSKWVKQSYLLVGKARFYKQNYPEAITTFKYMIKNLNNLDKKDKNKLVGSRAFQSESNISVLTQEKKKKKHQPARNDAFIWLVRAYYKNKEPDQATALISAIESDPNLPQRLRGDLHIIKAVQARLAGESSTEITALKAALLLQKDKHLQARWQFILAQLYEEQGHWGKAISAYHQVKEYKPSALMKFYASLNPILLQATHDEANYEVNKKRILRLAKKRKFAHYKNSLYRHLGQLALTTNHTEEGIAFLKKSLTFPTDQKEELAKSGILLAQYYYNEHQYRKAKKYYDDAQKAQPITKEPHSQRQKALAQIVKDIDLIQKEDSLQQLAGLPQDSLYALLNHIVADSLKTLKKKNLILEGESDNNQRLTTGSNRKDAFNHNDEFKGSKWYFYNENAKAKGFTAFKSKWGKRSLQDNWRLSNPKAPLNTPTSGKENDFAANLQTKDLATGDHPLLAENLLKELLKPLPLTPEARKASQEKTQEAYHRIIDIFYLELKDEEAALYMIQKMLDQKNDNPHLVDAYYKLYLIHHKKGHFDQATHYKQLILTQFPDSKYAQVLQPQAAQKEEEEEKERKAENLYNQAYQNYISGNLQEIDTLRHQALTVDSLNKQMARFDLLNALSLIKLQSDQAGVVALQQVIKTYPKDTAIVKRAQQTIDRIQHKEEIIAYLKKLKLKDDRTLSSHEKDSLNQLLAMAQQPEKGIEEEPIKEETKTPKPEEEAENLKPEKEEPKKEKAETPKPEEKDETLKPEKEKPKKEETKTPKPEEENLKPEKEEPIKEKAETPKPEEEAETLKPEKEEQIKEKVDSSITSPPKDIEPPKEDVIADSIRTVSKEDSVNTQPLIPYQIEREVPYFVVLRFSKTDTKRIQKIREAFSLYNAQYHQTDSILISPYIIGKEQEILIFRTFENEKAALFYYKELKRKSGIDIIPEESSSYYQFFFISRDNFILLNNAQDIKGYLHFFYQHYK